MDMDESSNESECRTFTSFEQFSCRVLEITNRYSSFHHVSYDPGNLNGKCARYPAYGDFPETYALRQYGNWWKYSKATYQEPYRKTDTDPLGAEDFITVRFEYAVIPTKLFIYETYTPGSVVRIWGRRTKEKWHLMWEGNPQKCPTESRKFQPDILRLNCFIDIIRLELNCSELSHHTCFDAILLIGLLGPATEFQLKCLGAFNMPAMAAVTSDDAFHGPEGENHFKTLPYELIMYIFEFLDLKSLSNCASVSTDWNRMANDPLLYKNISFKKYWYIVDSRIFDFLEKKSGVLKKLDLSWCGKDDLSFPRKFYQFLQISCSNLTHISLGNASYFNGSHLAAICSSCPNLEEMRLKNVYISDLAFCHENTLCKLTKLITLDLCCTNITSDLLYPLLKVNPNLKYLNLDFCEIGPLDNLMEVLSEYNKKLRGLSCWKGRRLTYYGLNLLGKCGDLEDLDLGWCLNVFPSNQTLESLAVGCKGLKRLILSAWRPLVDVMLLPIIEHCTQLEQLDLLSITGITPEFIEKALHTLNHLRFLELSYCDSIPVEKVDQWSLNHPHVDIKKCIDND